MDWDTIFKITSAFGLSTGIGALIVVAASGWLGRVWANRIYEKDRERSMRILEELKLDSDKLIEELRKKSEMDIFVHSIQFEKEFNIYENLWKEITKLTYIVNSLRPFWDTQDISKMEIKNERINKLFDELREIGTMFEINRPFYAPEIHKSIRKLLDVCKREGTQFYSFDLNSDNYWDYRDKNLNEIDACLSEICDTIRARVWR